METKVKQVNGAWMVADSQRMNFEMTYPDIVPRLDIAKELPYLLEDYKREITNIIQIGERIFEYPSRYIERITRGFQRIAGGVVKLVQNIPSFVSNISNLLSLGGSSAGLQVYTERSGQLPVVSLPVSQIMATSPMATSPEEGTAEDTASSLEEEIPKPQPKPQEEKQTAPLASAIYSREYFTDKELAVTLYLSNLDSVKEYDVRVAIEKDGVISDSFHAQEDRWRSSAFYISPFIRGSSTATKEARLRIRDDHKEYKGEATLVVRIREPGKTGTILFSGPIILFALDQEEKEDEEEKDLACVDINKADIADLTRVTQIGLARANQIMSLRKEAVFVSLEDLVRVSGIGPATVATIKKQGLACVEGEIKTEIEQEDQDKEGNEKEPIACVNINVAPREALIRIVHIGSDRADQILFLRQRALFSSVNDLSRVSGIGPVTVATIQAEGLACVGAEAPAQTITGNISPPIPSLEEEEEAECQPNSIDVNVALAQELEKLDGIGPVLAQNIIEERKINLFSSLNDLERVSGIAEGKINGLKEQGCAYVKDSSSQEEEEDAEDEDLQEEQENEEDQGEENHEEDNDDEDEDSQEEEELIFLAPGAPQTQTPTTSTTPAWQWEVAESSAGDIATYMVEWSQDPEFAEGVSDSSATEPLFIHQDVLEQGRWYFRVMAVDAEGNFSPYSTTGVVYIEIPTLAIAINEVAWMGTSAAWQHEWIELYNNTEEAVDLTGWKLSWDKDSIMVTLSSVIPAHEYYLLARTSAENLLDVEVNQVYSGNLRNGGTIIELRSPNGSLVDMVGCVQNENGECVEWFAGNNTTKQTMERKDPTQSGQDPSNWASNTLFARNGLDADANPINGTPGKKNSVSLAEIVILPQYLDKLFQEFNEVTMPWHGGVYISQDNLVVPEGKTLAIHPGVELRFNAGKQLRVYGTLQAKGTEDLPLLFTRSASIAWEGIRFFETSGESSEISHAIVGGGWYKPNIPGRSDITTLVNQRRFAIGAEGGSPIIRNVSFVVSSVGRGAIFLHNSNALVDRVEIRGANYRPGSNSINIAAILVSGGSPTIQDSVFQNNDIGVYVYGPGVSATILGNTFQEGEYPVYLSNAQATILENTVTDHAYHATAVTGEIRESGAVWNSPSMPFLFISNFGIAEGADLTIQSGTTILFNNLEQNLMGFGFSIRGTLYANGTEENPILFTDYASWSGKAIRYWRGINFFPTSTGSVISHATIQNAGDTTVAGRYVIRVEESDLELQNVTLGNGKLHEIVIVNVAEGAVFGSDILVLKTSSQPAFHVVGDSCPVFSNTEVQGGSAFLWSSPCSLQP
ncbi:MAG: helix-hairpin-helix domain-containing protein [bacterium]|nr:helix-hairpin-helix domain-containing protein [bacterium]